MNTPVDESVYTASADSGSTYRTVELAANLGARVIEAGWRGYAGWNDWTTSGRSWSRAIADCTATP